MNTKIDLFLQSLAKDGWNLSEKFRNEFKSINVNISNPDLLYKNLLDRDIKELSDGFLRTKLNDENEIFDANCVLQVTKCVNIAMPKNKVASEDNMFLRITLTDGYSNCNCLAIDSIKNINMDTTSPGSKVLLKGSITIKSKFLLLNKLNCQNLGGVVAALYDKWMSNKEMEVFKRDKNCSIERPPWIAFGSSTAPQPPLPIPMPKKETAPLQESADSTEFTEKRQAALSNAITSKTGNKVFANKDVKTTDENRSKVATILTQNKVKREEERMKAKKKRFENEDDDYEPRHSEFVQSARSTQILLSDTILSKLNIKEYKDDEPSENLNQRPPENYFENNQRNSNNRYPPNNRYQSNNRYQQNNQYQTNNQYPQNNQYAETKQYSQNNRYPPNNKYPQKQTTGKSQAYNPKDFEFDLTPAGQAEDQELARALALSKLDY